MQISRIIDIIREAKNNFLAFGKNKSEERLPNRMED